jgi:D-ribose pyranose/furanose isomerase RbsD
MQRWGITSKEGRDDQSLEEERRLIQDEALSMHDLMGDDSTSLVLGMHSESVVQGSDVVSSAVLPIAEVADEVEEVVVTPDAPMVELSSEAAANETPILDDVIASEDSSKNMSQKVDVTSGMSNKGDQQQVESLSHKLVDTMLQQVTRDIASR